MTFPVSTRSRRFPWRWVVVPAVLLGIAAWQFDLIPKLEEKSATIVGVPDDALSVLLDAGTSELSDLDGIQLSEPPRSSDPGTDQQFDDPLLNVFGLLTEPETGPASEPVNTPESGDRFGEAELPAPEQPMTRPSEIRRAGFERTPHPDAESNFVTTATRTESSIPTQPAVQPETAARIRQIDTLIESGEIVAAHRELSTIWWSEMSARELILDRILKTAAIIYASPDTPVMTPYQIQPGDTLEQIAAKFDVSWQYLEKLNQIDGRHLPAGGQLKTIRGPFGAVVDLGRMELTVEAHGYFVHRYDIGIGRDHSTPVGEYRVESRLENPTWYRPEGGIVAADDPANPLGEHWIGLGNSIGIHGTNAPNSIGTASSRGCLRMRNEDVAELYDLLTEKSIVLIRQ